VILEPFVEDELSLPSFSRIRRPARSDGQRRAWVTEIEAELKKRITTDVEVSVSGGLIHLEREDGSTTAAQNFVLGIKYQFLRLEDSETVMSAAVEWEIGGTGSASVGAERFDTVTPSVLVGQGFGRLPARVDLLRPLAVAALLQGIVPTTSRTTTAGRSESHAASVRGGLVIEYNLPYLQRFVRDVDLPVPLDRMVPIVEVERQTFVDREARGKSLGTVNPGVVWVGSAVQVGVEAVIPLNCRTASSAGVRAFLRFDLDDLLGKRFGEPVVRWFR